MQGHGDDVWVIKVVGWNHKRVSQRRWPVSEETRNVVYNHIIQPKLHCQKQVVVEAWNVNSLMDNQDHAFSSQCIIICKSGRDSAKVIINWTIRIITSNIDWTIKVMDYKGVRTYRTLVGMRI